MFVGFYSFKILSPFVEGTVWLTDIFGHQLCTTTCQLHPTIWLLFPSSLILSTVGSLNYDRIMWDSLACSYPENMTIELVMKNLENK
jgi:hypothetical protein